MIVKILIKLVYLQKAFQNNCLRLKIRSQVQKIIFLNLKKNAIKFFKPFDFYTF